MYVFALWAISSAPVRRIKNMVYTRKKSDITRSIYGAVAIVPMVSAGDGQLCFFSFFFISVSVTFQLSHHIVTNELPPIDMTAFFPNDFTMEDCTEIVHRYRSTVGEQVWSKVSLWEFPLLTEIFFSRYLRNGAT